MTEAPYIWKFPIEGVGSTHSIPEPADILSVGFDPGGALCVWVKVRPNAPVVLIHLALQGTGGEYPVGWDYQGFVLRGSLVIHVLSRRHTMEGCDCV